MLKQFKFPLDLQCFGGDQADNETEAEVDEMTQDYLEVIKNLKQNSVSKKDYDNLKRENKRLLEAVVDGQTLEQDQPPQYRDVNVIRNELFNKDHNNLEYVKLALELRNTLIANGEQDPFLPAGSKIAPTQEDVDKAELVAKVFQECVDYADGDSQLFTQELARNTKDVIVRRNK